MLLAVRQLVLGHVAGLAQGLDADPPRRPDVHLSDAAVVERLPEPGLGRQLQAAAHKVPDHVAVAHEDVDRGL